MTRPKLNRKRTAATTPPSVARKLFRRREAAEVLGTSINMLKHLERLGKLRPVRLGARDVFYRADEVEALAEGGER